MEPCSSSPVLLCCTRVLSPFWLLVWTSWLVGIIAWGLFALATTATTEELGMSIFIWGLCIGCLLLLPLYIPSFAAWHTGHRASVEERRTAQSRAEATSAAEQGIAQGDEAPGTAQPSTSRAMLAEWWCRWQLYIITSYSIFMWIFFVVWFILGLTTLLPRALVISTPSVFVIVVMIFGFLGFGRPDWSAGVMLVGVLIYGLLLLAKGACTFVALGVSSAVRFLLQRQPAVLVAGESSSDSSRRLYGGASDGEHGPSPILSTVSHGEHSPSPLPDPAASTGAIDAGVPRPEAGDSASGFSFRVVDGVGVLWAGMDKENAVSWDDAKCIICLEGYADGEVLQELQCKHHFHQTCIIDWLSRKMCCPLCQRPVLHHIGRMS